MDTKTLIFKPSGQGKFQKSSLYAMSMISKSFVLCGDYLLRSIRKPVDVETTDGYINIFAKQHLESSFTTIYVTGREHLDPKRTYVFMSNHESWMDIPAMFVAVPHSLRMVAKAGLMKIPIFGRALHNAGFIAIDRQNRTLAIKQLGEAKLRLKEGISIWISPEGTRTRDGTIGPFKKGGFHLAKELGTAIVPVFIEGAAAVMPADTLVVTPNREITVHFLPPILPEDFQLMPTGKLAEETRVAIIRKQQECLEKMRGAAQ